MTTKDNKYRSINRNTQQQKKRRQIKLWFVYSVILLGLPFCKKDFLEVPNGQILYRQDYIKDLNTTQEYLNGIYLELANSSIFHGRESIYPDLIADNIKPNISSPYGTLALHYAWAQQPGSGNGEAGNMNALSYSAYQFIRRCNFVIEKTDEYRGQDVSRSDLMKGEALTIRAIAHFLLVNVFAQSFNFTSDGSHPGVAYVTSSDYKQPVTRQTVAEIYTNLISDLSTAIALLPPVRSLPSGGGNTNLLIHRYAAEAMLARVYLFMGDYTNAKNLAVKVASAIPLMTAGYPSALFTPQDTEVLFQIAADPRYSSNFAGFYFRGYGTDAEFFPTSDIISILQEDLNDTRSAWVTDTVGTWLITKFPSGVVPGVFPESNGYYQSVIRSSEMYLTAAEAYANINNEDSARYYLDAIRQRANSAAVPINATGNALLDSIYRERRKELCFESLRMYDLLRWKKEVNRTDALSPAAQTLSYPNNKAIAPIPTLDVSVSGIPQNPGY